MLILLSRSLRRKLLATVLTSIGFILLYQAVVIDSHGAHFITAPGGRVLTPGAKVSFTATAYCKGDTTASGVAVQAGVAAADADLLPEGSVVEVDGVPAHYRGIYTVMDTGPKVLGRHVDLYMWSCIEALEFGRRPTTLTILRLGWNPSHSATSIK